ASALMVEHGVRHLPVKEGTQLVGLLTDRDLKRAFDPDLGLPPKEELFVRDVYLPEPYVVDASTPLDEVLEHLASLHIGKALVTKKDCFVGTFKAMDACRIYCQHLRSLFPSPPGNEAA